MDGKSESFRRQLYMEYPDYPEMDADLAVELLDKDELWIRSANTEFYYRYAIVENGKTGERFLIKKFTNEKQWFTILKWLADLEDHIEVILK